MRSIDHEILKELQHMTAALNRLTAAVIDLTNEKVAALALLSAMATEIRSALAAPNSDDQLNALADQIEANAHDIAAAVVANTPSAPQAPGDAGSSDVSTTTGGEPSTSIAGAGEDVTNVADNADHGGGDGSAPAPVEPVAE